MAKDPKEGGVCCYCRAPVSDEDRFCRRCGKNLIGFPWYYQHWGIILLTLLALGPLSLPLVWRSPVLSRTSKWVYTAAIAVLTWVFVLTLYRGYVLVKGQLEALGTVPGL